VASIQTLERRQRVELPIDEAFAFYGDARNLELITLPWLGFQVTTPTPIEMGVGTLIEYRLRLHRQIFDYPRDAVEREMGARNR
jgi:ligand-binding SRPBCC domain-containing protein